MTETVLACPACDSADNIFRRNPGKGISRLDEHDALWRCSTCGAEFDEPVRREPRGTHPPITGPAALLIDASADDVLGAD